MVDPFDQFKSIIIFGAGGFAREVQWAIDSSLGVKVEGFLSDDPLQKGLVINGASVLGRLEQVWEFIDIDGYSMIICGIGSPSLKKKFVERVQKLGLRFSPARMDPSVRFSDYSIAGEGTIICANSSITTNITIGKHVNINLNCTVGHDVVIGDYTNISPGVSISGNVKIGESVDIGTGAVILPGITIGNNSVIGAGAVVTKNIPENSLAVGVPAKVIRENLNETN